MTFFFTKWQLWPKKVINQILLIFTLVWLKMMILKRKKTLNGVPLKSMNLKIWCPGASVIWQLVTKMKMKINPLPLIAPIVFVSIYKRLDNYSREISDSRIPSPFSKVLFWLSFLGNKKIVSYKIIPSKNTQLFWKVRKQQKNGFYEIALELSEKSRNEIFNALTGTLKFSFLIFFSSFWSKKIQ